MSDILFNQERHVGIITLNRPSALNALNLPMVRALHQQLDIWERDASISMIVMQAIPGKAFCAGGDVRWVYHAGLKHDPQQMVFFQEEYHLNLLISSLTKPYIVLIDGITMGGGVGISLHGSFPIASERFLFAMPEAAIGFFPDIGASFLLNKCVGYVGTYLGLTGNSLNAADAYNIGLIKYVRSSADFPELLQMLIHCDYKQDPWQQVEICIEKFKQPILDSPILAKLATIEKIFQFKTVEEIVAACDPRDDDSGPWLQNLQQKSPLSLKVILRQLQKAKFLSLADCLAMDYQLVQHFMQGYDFYEGVRALLIDKDKTPHWQPAQLSEVSQSIVDNYFR